MILPPRGDRDAGGIPAMVRAWDLKDFVPSDSSARTTTESRLRFGWRCKSGPDSSLHWRLADEFRLHRSDEPWPREPLFRRESLHLSGELPILPLSLWRSRCVHVPSILPESSSYVGLLRSWHQASLSSTFLDSCHSQFLECVVTLAGSSSINSRYWYQGRTPPGPSISSPRTSPYVPGSE